MPADSLSRLTYISQFAQDLGPEDVSELVAQSALSNSKCDVTGVLMVSGGVFFQVLEGPRANLAALYERILKDERHTNILMLSEEHDVEERSFKGWSMRGISADEVARARLAPIREEVEAIAAQQRQVQSAMDSLRHQVWGELDRIVRTGDTQVGLRDGVVAEIS